MRQGTRSELVIAVLLCGVLSVLVACIECPTARPVGLINRPTFHFVDATGPFEVIARCGPQEQLLGGGYRFEEPRYPRDGGGQQIPDADGNLGGHELTVTASFPAADASSWVVRLVNPDLGPHGANIGTLVEVDAYCLPTSVLDLGMRVLTLQEPVPLNNVVNRLDVPAPPGAVVTSGGFEMSYEDPGSLLPGYNGFATVSTPLITNGLASGWQVGKMPTFNGRPARMTGYVLFSTTNLSAGAIRRVQATTDGLAYGSYAATPQCGEGEFATGGGYEIIGVPDQAYLIPHFANEDLAFPSFDGWRIHAVYGFQTEKTNRTSATDAPTTAGVYASLICLVSPRPTLCVRIKTPHDGTLVDLDSADPALATQTIVFTAEAFRGKTALPAGNLTWTVDGAPLGVGSPLSVAIPLPAPSPAASGYYHEFHVTVTVTDGSEVASATVVIYAGRIVIL